MRLRRRFKVGGVVQRRLRRPRRSICPRALAIWHRMPLRPLSGGFLRALSSTRPLARDSHPGTNTVRKARHSSFQDAPLLFLYYWPRFNFCCLKDSEREVGERSASLIASPPVVPFPHVVEHMAKGRDGGADAAPDYCTCSVGTGV
jgi:hypothetical protein